MKCENCGQELNEGVMFCENCGSAVNNKNVDVNKELDTTSESNSVDNTVNNEAVAENNPVITDTDNVEVAPYNSEKDIVSDNNDVNTNTSLDTSVVNNNDNNDNFTSGKKKKSKKTIIIILVILLAIIIGVFVFLFVFNKKSAKDIFVDSFEKFTSQTLNSDYKKKQSLNQNIKFKISGTGTNDAMAILNDISMKNNLAIDTTAKKMDEEITLNYEGSDVLSMGIYLRDNNMYIGLNGLYDKYIEIPMTETQSIDMSKIDNKVMEEALNEAFEKSLDEKYFTKSTKEISIDGDTKKVNAYTLKIDKNNIKEIAKNFIDSLANNKEFMKMIYSAFGMDSDEFKQSINEIDYSQLVVDSPTSITIYTKGITNSYVGIEFSVENKENSTSIQILNVDDNNTKVILKMGTIALEATINKKGNSNKNTVTASLDLMGLMKLSMVVDTVESENVEFKDINKNSVVDYDEFETNGINDVINNMSKNEKLIELITKLYNELGSEVDYSSLISIN